VENHHVSHQSRHGSTRRFKERSSDGISIRVAPAQKEVEERDMFMRRRDSNSTSSGGYWDEYSDASESSMESHRDPKHSRRTIARTIKESYTKSLSTHQPEEEVEFVQDIPEAALVAAQAYLLDVYARVCSCRQGWASKCRGL
jgi:hypothetical protein